MRSDAKPKVNGQFAYATDLHAEGMLWGVTVRSPYPHARIRGIDVSAAVATQGVLAVLTNDDVPGRHTYGVDHADQPVLAWDVVRYVGEPVAIVAAVDLSHRAARGAKVAVDYEVLEPVTEAAAGEVLRAAGSATATMTGADVVVSGSYEVGMQDQAILGPPSAWRSLPRTAVSTCMSRRGLPDDRDQVCAALSLPRSSCAASGRGRRHVRRP